MIGFDGKLIKKLQAEFDYHSLNRNQNLRDNSYEFSPSLASLTALGFGSAANYSANYNVARA